MLHMKFNQNSNNHQISQPARLDEPQNPRNMIRACLNSHFQGGQYIIITCCKKVGRKVYT
uniref:Uncharacterized protein n=1 Tax=Wuchereria bancrofti TaxID=6293 RepID=A0AAF5Q0L5_WUCBA